MSKEAFQYLLGKIGENDDVKMSSMIRLVLLLQLLGSESYQRLAGSYFYLLEMHSGYINAKGVILENFGIPDGK